MPFQLTEADVALLKADTGVNVMAFDWAEAVHTSHTDHRSDFYADLWVHIQRLLGVEVYQGPGVAGGAIEFEMTLLEWREVEGQTFADVKFEFEDGTTFVI